jgi:hypothetical protein
MLFCEEIRAVTAFSYIIFSIVAVLFLWTVIIAWLAARRGHSFIWKSAAHAYVGQPIYLGESTSEASLDKGKKPDMEQAEPPKTPSPPPTL